MTAERLDLSMALSDNDRTRPIIDGLVGIEGMPRAQIEQRAVDGADRHHKRRKGAGDRPRARINQMIIVIGFRVSGHCFSSSSFIRSPGRVRIASTAQGAAMDDQPFGFPASTPRADDFVGKNE